MEVAPDHLQVQETAIDYTNCIKEGGNSFSEIPSKYVQTSFHSANATNTPQWRKIDASAASQASCSIQFSIPNDLNPPVLFYYRLTNFYQNHRRYVKSVDEAQLKGDAVPASKLDSNNDCDPLVKNDDGKAYYPCGLMANSLFNDTFSSPVLLNNLDNPKDNQTYFMTDRGIAWTSDQARYGKTKYNASDIVPPPNWMERFPNGYTEDNIPDLKTWEAFQVWMRTAGLPTFSKLALRNDTQKMDKGTYQVDIIYSEMCHP